MSNEADRQARHARRAGAEPLDPEQKKAAWIMTQRDDLVTGLNAQAAGTSLAGRLELAGDRIAGRLVFTTSFGLEDQIVTHAIAEAGLAIELATLDTGRLFPETYDVWAETETRYGVRIKAFYPSADRVEALVGEQGINGFYGSFQQRKACCDVRKVEPLARALAGAAGWVTGLRGGQSNARGGTPFAEHDETRGLIKLNPLFDWERERLLGQIRTYRVPYNDLHDRGFLSIGCQPCTRPVRLGEDERAGRWWWEQSDQECGLHAAGPGRRANTEIAA